MVVWTYVGFLPSQVLFFLPFPTYVIVHPLVWVNRRVERAQEWNGIGGGVPSPLFGTRLPVRTHVGINSSIGSISLHPFNIR